MKMLSLLSLAMTLSFTACHYGKEGVEESLERNQEYKGKKAEREAATALPDDAAAKMRGEESTQEAPAADTATTE